MASTLALRERLRTSLWFVPALFTVGAVLLAVGLVALDRALSGSAPSRGGGPVTGPTMRCTGNEPRT